MSNESKAEIVSRFIVNDILEIAKRLIGRRAIQMNLSYSKFGNIMLHLQIKRGSPAMSSPAWERHSFEKYGFSLDASSYVPKQGSPGIDLRLTINPLSELDSLGELENLLLDTIRHELEHIETGGIDDPLVRKSNRSSYKYFLLKDEIPAAIAGLKLLAKNRQTDLSTEIDNYLEPFINSKFMSAEEALRVKTTWLNHSELA